MLKAEQDKATANACPSAESAGATKVPRSLPRRTWSSSEARKVGSMTSPWRAAAAALVPVAAVLVGGCSDSIVDCVAASSSVDYAGDVQGAPTLDDVIDDLRRRSDSVEVRDRTESFAVLYTFEGDRPMARLEVEKREHGWLVTSAASCGSAS